MRITGTILAFVLLFAGLIVLQIFLSKCQNKILGLIIPIISFVVTLIIPLNMIGPDVFTVMFLLQMVFIFLLANIPTIIFLAIYFAYKGKNRRKKGLDKMNIQDLD